MSPIAIALIILAITIVLFIWEPVPIVVTAMCISAGIGPSKALLALLFGAQFGGFVTLVGVGSNATSASVMAELGYESFGFFSITPFGIGVCILGTLYFTFIGSKLIPDTGYIPEFARSEKKMLDQKKAVIACITPLCVLAVIAVAPAAVPMHVAAVVGALVVVATRCMSLQEAIHAIDWNCCVASMTFMSTPARMWYPESVTTWNWPAACRMRAWRAAASNATLPKPRLGQHCCKLNFRRCELPEGLRSTAQSAG